jgi:ATP-dependent Clp protease ATP-binding subunit ClpB
VQGQEQVSGRPRHGLACCRRAEKEAIKRGDQFVASELFLLALADSKGDIGKMAREHGLTRKSLEAAIDGRAWGPERGQRRRRRPARALKKYCLDLTERARMGKLDPVIGRDDEIRRAIQVLQRRTKNNPC